MEAPDLSRVFRIPYHVRLDTLSRAVATTLVLTNLSLLLVAPVQAGQSSLPSSLRPLSSVVAVSSPNILNTLVQYPVPPVQSSTDLPTRLTTRTRQPELPVSLLGTTLAPPVVNPQVKSWMDMPVRQKTWRDGTIAKTIDTRLLGLNPFPQAAQPNPRLRVRQVVPLHHRYAGEPVVLLPGTPFVQTEHPNPRLRVSQVVPYHHRFVSPTGEAPSTKPFVNVDIPNPIRARFPHMPRVNRVLENPEPFSLGDWPNPIVPRRYVYNLTWLQNQVFNTPNVPVAFPARNSDYQNPVRAPRVTENLTWLQTQVYGTTDVPVVVPFGLYDQPNPRGPFRPEGTQINTLDLVTLESLPFVQSSLDLAPGAFQPTTWRDRTQINSVDLDTLANVHTLPGVPFYQTEFPNPVLASYNGHRTVIKTMDLDALAAGTPAPPNKHRLFIDLDTGHLIWRLTGGP